MSLPPKLYARLREALLQCGRFADERQLSALFVDERLGPWRFHLPEADSPAGRVDATINFLHDRRRGEGGRPALVLFLIVLREQIEPGDACHERLATVVGELEKALDVAPPQAELASAAAHRPQAAPDWLGLLQLLRERFNEEELRSLCMRLDVDYEGLPGRGRAARARELILFVERRNRLPDLVAAGRQLRPDLSWATFDAS